MRAAEDASEAFRRTLADTDVAEQRTVEITDHAELDKHGGSRAGGGGSEIAIEVPGPGGGFGQVLLYSAEDGSLSWHFPADIPRADVPSRGGHRRTYRVPRAIVPSEDQGGQRGILGAVAKKLLNVLVFPLIDPALGAIGDFFAARWETKHRRYLLREFGPDRYRTCQAPAIDAAAWARLSDGPALLFVHGTMSQSDTGFPRIPPDVMQHLHDRYDGRVFAFDHLTLSQTPMQNAQWLANQLPAGIGLTVDVVAHSRGGLVSRTLAERSAALALDGRLTVRTLIMVGTPNAGTALADRDHLSILLDRITGLLQFFPDNGVTDLLDIVLIVVKQLAVGAFGGLDGIMSMNPSGPQLAQFNRTPGSSAKYHAVAANYEPAGGSSLSRIARNGITDIVFGKAPNDLIVPTDGVFAVSGVPGFPVADPLIFDATASVDHSSHWIQPRFIEICSHGCRRAAGPENGVEAS
jgi:pimeloyl-ACP methyl ester carboxylesterase